MLAEGQQVHVVVDQHGHVEDAPHVGRDVEAVPAGHDRRVHREARGVLDWSRHPDADADQVAERASGRGVQALGRLQGPVEHGLRPVGDPQPAGLAARDRAGEVGQRDDAVGGAEVHAQHDSRVGVEPDARGRAASRRDVVAGRRHQPGLGERVDAHGDRRAGEAGQLGELSAGTRNAVAQDRQEFRGVTGDDAGLPDTVGHARIEPQGWSAVQRSPMKRRLLIDNRQKSRLNGGRRRLARRHPSELDEENQCRRQNSPCSSIRSVSF